MSTKVRAVLSALAIVLATLAGEKAIERVPTPGPGCPDSGIAVLWATSAEKCEAHRALTTLPALDRMQINWVAFVTEMPAAVTVQGINCTTNSGVYFYESGFYVCHSVSGQGGALAVRAVVLHEASHRVHFAYGMDAAVYNFTTRQWDTRAEETNACRYADYYASRAGLSINRYWSCYPGLGL